MPPEEAVADPAEKVEDELEVSSVAEDAGAGGESPTPPAPSSPPEEPVQYTGIRDYLSSMGAGDISQKYDSDQAALQALYHSYRQQNIRDADAEIGRRYRDHEADFREYLASRQKTAEQQKVESGWNPPEYNEAWLGEVTRDEESGQLRLREGSTASPEIVGKLQRYLQFQADWQRKLLSNPEDALGFMKRSWLEEAKQEFARELASRDAQSQAQSILSGHADWLYQNGPNGPTLTPDGVRYQQKVQQFSGPPFNVNDPSALDALALQAMRAEDAGQQQATASNNGHKKNFAKNTAQRAPNLKGASMAGTEAGESLEGKSFRELLGQRFKQAGINDDTIGDLTGEND